MTTAFRVILAIPHLILVGGPAAVTFSWVWRPHHGPGAMWAGPEQGGVLGTVAGVIAVIAWFAIPFTGRYPSGLRDLVVFYLRWRARAMAYVALLRDEYPPLGDGPYPVTAELDLPDTPRGTKLRSRSGSSSPFRTLSCSGSLGLRGSARRSSRGSPFC